MQQIIQSVLTDANTQWVLLSTLLLGIASGVLGSFALLRKQSLIGDAVAHAALPGICIAFLLIGEKDFISLLIGATFTGLLAAYLIQFITSQSRIKEDTSIGLVLSVFFGAGIMLLTKVAQSPSGNKSGLDDFIFGQAASLVGLDVQIMMVTALALIVVTFALFKEFKLSTFDPEFARGIGLPVGFLNFLFLSLLVITVVIGIQAVGVIMMAALLITPAIAARFWTDSLGIMVIVAGLIGAFSGIAGTSISTLQRGLSTGPLIVLVATVVFVLSMLFAPKRGLVSIWLKRWKNDQLLTEKGLLIRMYEFELENNLSTEKLHSSSSLSVKKREKLIHGYELKGWIESNDIGWNLTEQGKEIAIQQLVIDRLAELKEMYPNQLTDVNIQEYLDQPLDLVNQKDSKFLMNRLLDIQSQYDLQPIFSGKRGG
ncbi:manganese ABC transporter permease [Bacillus coahuilensis p1.1.43]|uniref:Manganese transport system membrane protein MntC n=1 Tax=Bacillus coahuilensis p1.1.43 TaxID=1150625 RepID=A0A147K8I4_9BACI|nr:metal ABC transporter permease [Bacillus coahuilensis]KUP06510.1 manganese ABC transporter permease [Bacillus coahuilensis p1.1.43]